MAIIITWIALCIVAGVIAGNKGRSSVGFFFLSLFLSPLVGVIAALIAKTDEKKLNEDKISTGDSKKCPFCAEIIKAEAMVCRYCGRELAEAKEVDWIVKKYTQEKKEELAANQEKKKLPGFEVFVVIIVLLVLIGSIIVERLSNDIDSEQEITQTETTNSAKPKHALNKTQKDIMFKMIEDGYLRVNAQMNRAEIHLPLWEEMNYSIKEDFCAGLAIYVGNEKGTQLYWVEIHDMRSGKKLAKFSQSWGFTIY